MRENAERTRQLAEKALADLGRPLETPTYGERLPAREARRRMRENAERTRRLALKAQAELDARKAREAEAAD